MLPKKSFLLPKDTDSHHDNQNYKELYLQCKKNVSLFMRQVDKEITNILSTHEAQKRKLMRQIQHLKAQLRTQDNTSGVYSKNPSIKSFHHSKNGSEVKERSHSIVSKDTVEECLSRFAGLELKSKRSERTMCHQNENSLSLEKKKPSLKRVNPDKQNSFLPNNLYEEPEINMQSLQTITNTNHRDKRIIEKKPTRSIGRVDDVKDVLKDIRGKLNSNQNQTFKRKDEEKGPVVKIISPEMFTSRTSRE